MKYRFGLPKKIVFGAAATFLLSFANAQTVSEGIVNLDSHKYAKAKEVFNQMIAKSPTAENYYYLGYSYLSQFEPNFELAKENFDKGLAIDSKSYLNKIGLATIKLGKGQKASAITELTQVAKESKEKDAEVLYRIGEALTMFENNNDPALAITYINKAIEKAQKYGVPPYYYYTLGDAYRLTRDPGNAMTAYDRASEVAKNKASVFYRMATLWMAAKQYKKAEENIVKAINTDATYAPAYKAQAQYNKIFQKHEETTQSLINYTKYADEDPSTALEIAKLYFINSDFAESKATLDKVFDKVNDPIKFKLRAYLQYNENDFVNAKTNLETYYAKVEQSRIIPSDAGLEAVIYAGLASKEADAAAKTALMQKANEKLAVVKAAKDDTLDWDSEFAKASSGAAELQAKADAGPSNDNIVALKKQVAANKEDTTALFNLAMAYQEVSNWDGAALAWQKMNDLLPTWEPAYYSKGYALQQAGYKELAAVAFQKYIDVALTKTPAEQQALQETLFGAYYSVAYLLHTTDKVKANEALQKALAMKPNDHNSLLLQKELMK
ncbi:tetratricopeptide repeat protein [Cloacibacterium normanense]|uniref:tetratricopeptide repeat protein n=1 Tax=Cloacibacterium normanense TaxID=237258 RepID=UPI00352E13DD